MKIETPASARWRMCAPPIVLAFALASCASPGSVIEPAPPKIDPAPPTIVLSLSHSPTEHDFPTAEVISVEIDNKHGAPQQTAILEVRVLSGGGALLSALRNRTIAVPAAGSPTMEYYYITPLQKEIVVEARVLGVDQRVIGSGSLRVEGRPTPREPEVVEVPVPSPPDHPQAESEPEPTTSLGAKAKSEPELTPCCEEESPSYVLAVSPRLSAGAAAPDASSIIVDVQIGRNRGEETARELLIVAEFGLVEASAVERVEAPATLVAEQTALSLKLEIPTIDVDSRAAQRIVARLLNDAAELASGAVTITVEDPEWTALETWRASRSDEEFLEGAFAYLRRFPGGRFAADIVAYYEARVLEGAETCDVARGREFDTVAEAAGLSASDAATQASAALRAFDRASSADTYLTYQRFLAETETETCAAEARKRSTEEHWRDAAQMATGDARAEEHARVELANALAGDRRWSEARDELEALRVNGFLAGPVKLGALMFSEDDFASSAEMLNEALAHSQAASRNDLMWEAYFYLGRMANSDGKHQQAVDLLSSAIERAPSCGECVYWRGVARWATMSQRALAREDFRLIAEDPDGVIDPPEELLQRAVGYLAD